VITKGDQPDIEPRLRRPRRGRVWWTAWLRRYIICGDSERLQREFERRVF
jgi:hypothetical protein